MIVLALDTALAACQAAVVRVGPETEVLGRRIENASGRAEAIVGVADAALAEAGAGFADIERVAVTVGPGSFTGIRVALAFARGLSLVIEAPVIGVGTLDAFALEAASLRPHASGIAAVVDARHEALYVGLYDQAARPLSEPVRMRRTELAETLRAGTVVIGDAADLLAREDSDAAHDRPREGDRGAAGALPPANVLQRGAVDLVALARCAAATIPPFGRATPLYLSEADAIPAAASTQVARR